ncbi:cyclin-like protein [Plenodomus tracheiphilus IPT5]|uniref:RNA polymerase II holoenzyme cyclin-like subunit n=1 Tax=Plenodomus tracheiphilus IPT5 TaxID=1408161 RepID=A0A6A7AZ26_9PLEO|nr:cyclin-like protein [Plenodomus tracheiphilus IPT5]
MIVTEDSLFRSSTQFKHWSFTKPQLDAQRRTTNVLATERVKANVARLRAQRAESDGPISGVETGSGTSTPNPGAAPTSDLACLTAEEELKIVDDFCERAVKLGTHCGYNYNVIATCIQYLRRFYLYNSPMTYHVQNILRTSLFLATKSEFLRENVENFAANSGRNVTAESVLAPEHLVMQGLRYNLDVRHPFRGLKGVHLELTQIAHGKYDGPGDNSTSADIQSRMQTLPSSTTNSGNPPRTKATVAALEARITNAYTHASRTLKTAAQYTDVYFLYTPSQIMLSAHLLADSPLTLFYLSLKLTSSSPIYAKLLSTLRACAELLSSHRLYVYTTLPQAEQDAREAVHQAHVKALIAKLKMCRDPDKVDLVKLNQAHKRDAVGEEGLDEHKAKKRKLAREGYEKESDAFWGPELGK